MASMEACIPALRRYAGALLRDRQEVDDLVHDCLVRALERLHTRQDDGNLRAWLFTILHNLFVSQARRGQRRGGMRSLDEVAEETFSQRASQETHVETNELLRAVDALPQDQRSVLLLVVVEDLTYAEVAVVLGIPIGTVMSRLARARDRLARTSGRDAAPALRRVK
ncbi:MAG: sigma-70 family RNA polymerase sigma factor [Acetobacteraceae bacterium]